MTDVALREHDDISRRLWTAAEFERLGELGLFDPQERLELVQGEIIVKMSPQGSRHASIIHLVAKALGIAFPSGYVVRIQTPLALGPNSRPEPDVAVVAGTMRQYMAAHPTTAALVVEISDSTLALDRKGKLQDYAAAGIPEYWIVNLVDNVLEVYRDPIAASDAKAAPSYRSDARFSIGQTVTPLAAPGHMIPVADLLP